MKRFILSFVVKPFEVLMLFAGVLLLAMPLMSGAQGVSPESAGRASLASPATADTYPFLNASLKSQADAAWARYQTTIGDPLVEWVRSAPSNDVTGTVFYPFSGPDFVTLTQIFPNANRYVMVALQTAGRPANPTAMSNARAAAFQQKFLQEWIKFSHLGFFRTLDLNQDQVDEDAGIGVSTIIKTFAIHTGFEVTRVVPIAFNPQSMVFEETETGNWRSVRFFAVKEGRPVIIDYISLDLSDGSLASRADLQAWLAKEASNPVLIKAASHLLQESYFSVLRDILAQRATMIVQDETGLEYDELVQVGPVDLYGWFLRPHRLFNPNKQRSLAKAYVDRASEVKTLPFAFSYNKDKDRNCLQVAIRVP